MNDIPFLGRDDDRRVLKQFLAHYDAPAFARRARQVQEAFDHLVSHCRRQREEWLSVVRTRLGLLHALAGDWVALRPWLANEDQLRMLWQLQAALDPQLRLPVEPSSSPRKLTRALRELKESIEYFNGRWQGFLETVDLTRVNELREAYNRYYLLEKECAVRSARVARQGFARLHPLTVDDLAALLPPLPVPRLKA
jgi:hypothetical protein